VKTTYKIVRDMRILKALQKRGFVKFCTDTGTKINSLYTNISHTCYYVYEAKLHFKYNNKNYGEMYIDGCFFPFVVEYLNL